MGTERGRCCGWAVTSPVVAEEQGLDDPASTPAGLAGSGRSSTSNATLSQEARRRGDRSAVRSQNCMSTCLSPRLSAALARQGLGDPEDIHSHSGVNAEAPARSARRR
jgi:hypothetical protein